MAAVLGLVASVADADTPVVESPLRVVEGGIEGVTTALELDVEGYAALRDMSEALLADFVLAPGLVKDLDVRRFDVFGPDAQVVLGTALGDVPTERPDVVLLRGRVAGEPDSSVYLGLSPYGVNGRISTADGDYIVSSGPYGGDQPIVVYRMDTLPEGAINWKNFVCGAEDIAQPMSLVPRPHGGHASRGSLPCRTAQIAIETDWQYVNRLYGGNTAAASAYATTLFGAVSEIYVNELNTSLQITYLRVWSSNNDPYPDSSSVDTRLEQFRNHWQANMGSVHRDAAHMLTGRSSGSGGVAWVGALCGSYGYAVSGHLDGYFPYPLQDDHPQNWDLVVVAHELGHNFGAPHTHSMNPPVDRCGSGVCADRHLGTIMSYCHTCTGGMTNIELTLHPRVINEQILPFLNFAGCVAVSQGPDITQNPEFVEVCAGEPATLTVGVIGAPPLSFQWRKGGVNIPGATGQTYSIASATAGDVGIYDVVVSNSCGTTTSGQGYILVTTCAADMNGDCTLDVTDFSLFRTLYLQGAPEADFNGDGRLTVDDFSAFRAAYLTGCQ